SGSSKQNIQQHTHSPKKPSSLRNSVDLTNTPDILLPTPTPTQNNQPIRNPKRPIDRSNTSSPVSWHKNQKMYTPSVTNSENEEQEISQNIERAFNQNNQNDSEPQQIQIQSSFKGRPYTTYLTPAWNQPLEVYTENQPQNQPQTSRNEGISALANESDNESLTKEQQEFLEEMDEE
ncbi:3902_t:CDS:1, partial [Dentiscutata heterogama]